jgi:hypothetical protein
MKDLQIKFMSQNWQIRDSHPDELPEDTLGLCDPKTNTITVDPDLPLHVWQQTLGHELVHLIEMTLNLCLTEQQVDTLSTGLIHLLKENPCILALYHTESVDDIIDFTAEDVT